MVYTEPYIYTGAPSILLSIMTVTLNIFVIKFYWKRKLTVVPLLYTFIASLDILIAIGIMHLYAIFLLHKRELIGDRTADVNVMILSFFIQVSSRCSVLCNLILAVSRTVMILKPFYHISIKKMKLACILYVVPWIVFFGLNVHEFNGNYFTQISDWGFTMGVGLALKTYRLLGESLKDFSYIIIVFPDFVAFLVPVTIVIITCIMQVITLHRSSQFQTSCNQRHVTITVLLMSTLFVLCNSALAGYMAIWVICILTDNVNLWIQLSSGRRFSVITMLSATVLPILNAAFNPVIIITRSSGMRRTVSDLLRRIFHWIRD